MNPIPVKQIAVGDKIAIPPSHQLWEVDSILPSRRLPKYVYLHLSTVTARQKNQQTIELLPINLLCWKAESSNS